jgi:hypothetical protein
MMTALSGYMKGPGWKNISRYGMVEEVLAALLMSTLHGFGANE